MNESQNNQNLVDNQNLEDNQNLNYNQNVNDIQNLLLTQELEEKKKKLIQCYGPAMSFILFFEVLLGLINLNVSSEDYVKALILFISSCFISFIMILPLCCITVKSNIPQILFILFIKAILVIILIIIGISNSGNFFIYFFNIPPFIFIILSITFECQKSKLEK